MRDSFIKYLIEVASDNNDIMFLTGDLGYKIFDEYINKFPDQYINVGVAEQSMTGLAMGMALEGRRAITYSIANFPTLRVFEQIRNDIAYHNADVKIVAVGGGLGYGALGMSHHGTERFSTLRSMPKLTLLTPGDAWEAGEVTKYMLNNKGPFYLSLEKADVDTSKEGEVFEFGKVRIVRDGKDVTLIAAGAILSEALAAADDLSIKGIESRVLSVHCLKPLDEKSILNSATETGGLITIEDNVIQGGLGGAVAEVCMKNNVFPGFFDMIGLDNEFTSIVGDQYFLRQFYGLDKAAIINKVLSRIKK